MNKKILILIICCILFLVGCEKKVDEEKYFKIDFEVSQISVYKDPTLSLESEYNTYKLNEEKEINGFLSKLNVIKYKEVETVSKINQNSFKYIIKFNDNYSIIVIDINEFVIYKSGFYKICDLISGDFSFLNKIEFGETVVEAKIDFNEEDLQTILLDYENMSLNLTANFVVQSILLNTKYYNNTVDEENLELEYTLHFDNDKHLYIYSDGVISFENNGVMEEYKYMTLNNEFNYLSNIITDDKQSFDFENVSYVQLSNSEDVKKQLAETEIATFIANFDNIKYQSVTKAADYNVGTLQYMIKIDNDSIGVYKNNLIIINDGLYMVTEGNFEFLNNIKFGTSSGYLPWV